MANTVGTDRQNAPPLERALLAVFDDALRPVLSELAALRQEVAALRQQTAPLELEPLGKILGCSPRAALARASRDPELRRLAVRLGRRRFYRRSEVMQLLAQRERERCGD
jgi:hypothetical protein